MQATQTPAPRVLRSGREVLNETRQPVLVALSRALRRAFAATIDDLLERLLKERAWEQRQSIDDALDLLRSGREQIEVRFDKACAEDWQARTGSSPDPIASASAGAGAGSPPAAEPRKAVLSLVDDSAMGDQLLIGRIAARSRRRMDEEQVDGMRARFGALLGRDWFADNEYPACPDAVFEALRKALAEFGQPRVVLFLLEIFEPKLSADLSTLYADLNRRFVEFGVLPEIRYQIAKSANSAASAAGGPGAPAGQGTDDRHPAGADGAPLYASTSPAASPASGARPGVAGGPSAGAAAAGSPGGFEQAGDPGGDPGGDATFAPGRMPMAAVADLAEQMDQRIGAAQGSATRYLSNPEVFGDARPAGAAQATEQLLDALTTLQTSVASGAADVASLVSTARAQSTAVAKAHGSPLERLIIETVSLIFEHVYEDEAIADAIKQQLLRLQVAAFKAALIDPSFFARPEHPMRRFIDRIAEVGSDPDFETQAGAALVDDVAALVTWILNRFERDLGLFAEALERLSVIVSDEIERRRARLAKVAAAAEKAEQMEAVRAGLRRTLTASLSADVPEFVGRFVAEPWTEVVSRIRSGAAHAPFDAIRARRTLDVLAWSVAPKSASDIARLAAELPQLIADLSRGLSFIAYAEAERELFFSELLAWHGATIDEAKRRIRLAPAAPQSAPAASAAPAPPTAVLPPPPDARPADGGAARPGIGTSGEPTDAADALAASDVADQDPPTEPMPEDDPVALLDLENGAEVEIISATGAVKRFKLGWMSPARTVFIFSRYPRDHWTARRPTLNAMLADGRLRVLDRGAETARAIETLKSR